MRSLRITKTYKERKPIRVFLRIRKAVRKYTNRLKSISVFLEKAKSHDKIIEFLQGLKNQYASITILQFLVKNSAEILKRMKPDHLKIFPSLGMLRYNHLTLHCKRKIDSQFLRKRILMI